MQSKKAQFATGGVSENETPRMRNVILKEETYNRYGSASAEIEIGSIRDMGRSRECLFRKYRDGPLIRRTYVNQWK